MYYIYLDLFLDSETFSYYSFRVSFISEMYEITNIQQFFGYKKAVL